MRLPASLRRLLVLLLLCAGLPAAAGASTGAPPATGGPWNAIAFKPAGDADVRPAQARAFALEPSRMREALRTGSVAIPAPDGSLPRFRIEASPVVEPAMLERYPDVRTYAGVGEDDPTARVRLDSTPQGFHASVVSEDGNWLVDPRSRGDARTHLSYFARDGATRPERAFADRIARDLAPRRSARTRLRVGETVTRRTYRLALFNDPSFARYHGDDDDVFAAKATIVNRVNQVYNDDLGTRLVLVGDPGGAQNLETATEFTGANRGCGSAPCFRPATGCTDALLEDLHRAAGQLVGADAFDIAHIVGGDGLDGTGGLASLGVAGADSKAQGCSGLEEPVGDGLATGVLAHEIGHQLGADHTFDGCPDQARDAAAAVEPGSGMSIMGYGGICGRSDAQDHADPYFSQRSIEQIRSYQTTPRDPDGEVQTVSLSGWGAGDELTISGPAGSSTPLAFEDYAIPNLEDAVEEATGPINFSVESFTREGALTRAGFSIAYDDRVGDVGQDREQLTVELEGATGFVGTTVSGGEVENAGNPAEPTANRPPTVTAPAARTIPARTPFTLTGSATDADGDALVSLWEENDGGGADPGTVLLSNAKAVAPLFSMFPEASTELDATESPAGGTNAITAAGTSRTFPDPAQIAAGNTNAASGSCPDPPADPAADVDPAVVACYSEFLPATARTLNFRLTSRDRALVGGGVGHADVALDVDPAAGPFRVTSQAAPASVAGGSAVPITWDVAGTAAGAIGTAAVRISYSVDGGLTFPTVLAPSTANDGDETVTVPPGLTTAARFKVEAVDNVFFDVSHADLTVVQRASGPGPDPDPAATSIPAGPAGPTATATPTPTPIPTVMLPAAAKLSFVGKAKAARSGRTFLVTTGARATCATGKASCTSKVVATAGRLTVGRATGTFKAGKSARIRFKLTRAGARRLRKARRLKLKLVVTVTRSGARAATTTRTVTLKRPRG